MNLLVDWGKPTIHTVMPYAPLKRKECDNEILGLGQLW